MKSYIKISYLYVMIAEFFEKSVEEIDEWSKKANKVVEALFNNNFYISDDIFWQLKLTIDDFNKLQKSILTKDKLKHVKKYMSLVRIILIKHLK